MKKLLLCLLCLGLCLGITGCSNEGISESDNQNKKTSEISIEDKIANETVYIGGEIKEFEKIEERLINAGYKYYVSEGNLFLVNPNLDTCKVISYSKTKTSDILSILTKSSKHFTYITDSDSDTTAVMGSNDNIKWSYNYNNCLGDDIATESDLEDMLSIKKEYSSWARTNNISYLELKYFMEIYYDVIINKNNTNIVDIKMEENKDL